MKNRVLSLSYKVWHVKILRFRFIILVLCAKTRYLCAEFKIYVPKSVIYAPNLSFMCRSKMMEKTSRNACGKRGYFSFQCIISHFHRAVSIEECCFKSDGNSTRPKIHFGAQKIHAKVSWKSEQTRAKINHHDDIGGLFQRP